MFQNQRANPANQAVVFKDNDNFSYNGLIKGIFLSNYEHRN